MEKNLSLSISLLNGTTNEFTPNTATRSITVNENKNDSFIITNEEITIDVANLGMSNLLIIEGVYNETSSPISEGEDAPFTIKTVDSGNPEITYPLQSGICVISPSVQLTSLKVGTSSAVPVRINYYIGSYA